jgi:hypothetical protein
VTKHKIACAPPFSTVSASSALDRSITANRQSGCAFQREIATGARAVDDEPPGPDIDARGELM